MSRCRDDINLEGHRRPWVCSLWTSTAGEKLDQTVQTRLEELLMWKDSLYICSLPFFFLITGELSECHQVFLWTTGGHQAVYVELETNALFLCYVCVIFTVSSQRSDRTLRRRTPMTPWRFIRCRYSVGLNHCFLIIIILFLSLRKEFVCHLIFFFLCRRLCSKVEGQWQKSLPQVGQEQPHSGDSTESRR